MPNVDHVYIEIVVVISSHLGTISHNPRLDKRQLCCAAQRFLSHLVSFPVAIE